MVRKLTIVCLLSGIFFIPGIDKAIGSDTYINFFWNQHQPSYINPISGHFEYPFVRINALRAYYFMAAVLIDGRNDINTWEIEGNEWIDTGSSTGQGFPFVHTSINISGVLLQQLVKYVDELAPCFEGANTPEECRWEYYPTRNPHDPDWNDNSILFERTFDLLVKPQTHFTTQEKQFILFNSSYITPRTHHVFYYPSYSKLEEKRQAPGGGNPDNWLDEELRDYKIWYALSPMHYIFKETDNYPLKGHAPDGSEMIDYVTGIKTYGQFTTWGTPSEEWFGSSGETLDPDNPGGYSYGSGSTFEQDGRICRHFTDWDAQMIAIQHYKILKYVIPIHRKLQNTVCPHDGYPQIEVVTTPYSHPILPLIYDTDNYFNQKEYDSAIDSINYSYHGDGETASGQFGPNDPTIYDDDVYNQVALGAEQYFEQFNRYPHGMWPGEGSVGESVIYAFKRNGVKWIASGNETCQTSGYAGDPGRIYRIDEDSSYLDGDNDDAMSIWFRSETDLIGFDGGYFHPSGCGFNCDGDSWAFNIIDNHITIDWGHDKFWSHTADGENVWGFFHRFGSTFFEYTHLPGGAENYGLYYRINRSNEMIPPDLRWYSEFNLKSVTPSSSIGIRDGEYTGDGIYNIDLQWELEPLSEGSWVFGDFTTWIGEENENQAWIHLRQTREEMMAIGASDFRPHPYLKPFNLLENGRQEYLEWKLWYLLYTAEGSDPFWWYGADQCFGSDEIFCDLFREHLVAIYVIAKQAGYDFPYPYMQIHPIFSPGDNVNNHHANGAATDEDYLYDTQPPPGHGNMIPVPPLTKTPIIEPESLPADEETPGIVTIEVYEEAIETTEIAEVRIDLRPIGGEMTHELFDDGDLFFSGDDTANDGIYSTRFTVASTIEPGRYVLIIKAIDTDGAFTDDYAFITVTEPMTPPQFPMPNIRLAGYGYPMVHRGDVVPLLAWINTQSRAVLKSAKVYYAGTRTAPLDSPLEIGDMHDDGQHGDFKAQDGIYGYLISVDNFAEFNDHIYRIQLNDNNGRNIWAWPAMVGTEE